MNKKELKKELKLTAKEELLLDLFNEEMERLSRDFINSEMILLVTKLGIDYIKIIVKIRDVSVESTELLVKIDISSNKKPKEFEDSRPYTKAKNAKK